MTANIYPASPLPIYPVVITPRWDTLTRPFDSGAEQRRQKSLFPVFDVSLRYAALSDSDIQTLFDFYMARKGAFESFYFFDPRVSTGLMSTSYDALYVDTGDGSTDVFDLPGKSTSGQAIYVDGTLQTVTTHYTILTGGGDGGADRVDFVTAPTLGQSISCDFAGALRVHCRFAVDNLSFEWFKVALQNVGIQLKGLSGTVA